MNQQLGNVLFLCTGNYYRSRFAEYYFNHLASSQRLTWRATSKGLALHPSINKGPLSPHSQRALERLKLLTPLDGIRDPEQVTQLDLLTADHIVAMHELEHQPMIRTLHPEWTDRIEYWLIGDIHEMDTEVAVEIMIAQLDLLVERLREYSAVVN